MSKPIRHCIFCGGTGMSKEHLVGEWISRQFGLKEPSHTIAHGDPPNVRYSRSQGDFYSRKIRNVCKSCNNGWMSAIQENVKPLLTNLIVEGRAVLDNHAQIGLAAWLSMTTIMSEHLDPGTISISDSQRTGFYNDRIAMPGSSILIGVNGSRLTRFYKHVAVHLHNGPSPVNANFVDSNAPNTQSTTFVVGKFVGVVISSVLPMTFTVPPALWDAARMIAPYQGVADLRGVRPLTEGDIDLLSRMLYTADMARVD